MSRPPVKTPPRRPADGGIMRFFSTTPKTGAAGGTSSQVPIVKTESFVKTEQLSQSSTQSSTQPLTQLLTQSSTQSSTPSTQSSTQSSASSLRPSPPTSSVFGTPSGAPVRKSLYQRSTPTKPSMPLIPSNPSGTETSVDTSSSTSSFFTLSAKPSLCAPASTPATGTTPASGTTPIPCSRSKLTNVTPVSGTSLASVTTRSSFSNPASASKSKWALQLDSEDDDDVLRRTPAKRQRLQDSGDESASEPSDSGSDTGSDSDGFVVSDDDAPRSRKSTTTRRKSSTASIPSPASRARPTSAASSSPANRARPMSSSSSPAKARGGAAGTNADDEDDEDDEDSNQTNAPGRVLGLAADLSIDLPKWVLPPHRLDGNRLPPSHPDFDERTVYIPPAEFAKFTPATKQFWEIKSKNFDVVLFFKMGKFYELFDVDAEVGIRELGLLRMGSGRLHVGFPEIAFAKHAEKLVALGYKVGRVEQTQTPKQLAEANKNAAKGQKASVVRREMCSIATKSTVQDSDIVGGDHSSYLLSLFELSLPEEDVGSIGKYKSTTMTATEKGISYRAESSSGLDVVIGVCFVDAASGAIHVGRLYDDRQRTKLRTLFAQARPCEVTYIKNGLSAPTEATLRSCLAPGASRSPQLPKDYGDAASALAQLEKHQYFAPESANRKCADDLVGADGWPLAIAHFRDIFRLQKPDRGDEIGVRDPSSSDGAMKDEENEDSFDNELTMLCGGDLTRVRTARELGVQALLTALGGCTSYLRRLLVDHDTLPLCNVRVYSPLSQLESTHLVLDGQSLLNLEILENQEGGREGSLLAHLDHCATAFGKRMLRGWVARPLGRIADINARLDAVEELMSHGDVTARVVTKLRKVPDLERLLARVRVNGSKVDNAVMYENVGKQRVDVFLKTIKGFGLAVDIIRELCDISWTSSLLSTLINVDGVLNDVAALVTEFEGAFDHAQAARDGHIVPQKGVVGEYDTACDAVAVSEAALQDYLSSEQIKFKDRNITYFHRMREVYQLEIPLATVSKIKIPLSYEQVSQTKTVRRFYTSELKKLIENMETAKERREELLQDVTRRVFYKFGVDFPLWSRAVGVLGEVDCLISLAMVSRYAAGGSTCRPEFVTTEQSGGRAILELRNSIHPSMSGTVAAAYEGAPTRFIPNDVLMGCEENPSRFVLVSGPNMGGKSTLLRQVCCAVIMAQIGCFVAAEKCILTPCDRIFTRVGANDRIMQGQSTFLVELEETSSILRHASPRSLVILDELGRGTSTFDGTSIAFAVIEHLAAKTQCLTLFSTHYHMLLEEFKANPLVSMFHMACEARSRPDLEGQGDVDEKIDVTFLYKFIPGVCSKSFGMNVATLAGLPRHIVLRAKEMSELFEEKLQLAHQLVPMDKRVLFNRIRLALKNNDTQQLQNLQKLAANLVQV